MRSPTLKSDKGKHPMPAPCVVLSVYIVGGLAHSAGTWTVVKDWNAIPKGTDKMTVKDVAACEAAASAANALQFSFNAHSRHCYISTSATFAGLSSDHVTSGCLADKVSKCAPAVPTPTPKPTTPTPAPTPPAPASGLPSWTAPAPDEHKPLGGYKPVPGAVNMELCHGDVGIGTYNHAAMIDYHNGQFIVAWKNGPETEDKSGQRILYSQSTDGSTWTPVNNDTLKDSILFPSTSTPGREGAMFVGPPIIINGRVYVGASPGKPTGAAQGAQFCLWSV